MITDMTMPNMAGIPLSKEILKIRPDIPVILCTGYSDRLNGNVTAQVGVKKLFMKPLTRRKLAEAIRQILDYQK